MVSIREFFQFYKLTKKRLYSEEDYLDFQRYQAKIIIEKFKNKNINLKNKKVLDIGCGLGGYSVELINNRARVISVDINEPKLMKNISKTNFIKCDAIQLCFPDNYFDFIFCSSLIEHIKEPKKLISEIHRVLSKDGLCYLVFPPFYSPVGGHQFKPFHLFGEKAAIKLSRMFKKIDSNSYSNSFGNWGLYPITIREIKNLLIQKNFKIMSISTRFSPINFAKMPVLNELLTWSAEFMVKKQDNMQQYRSHAPTDYDSRIKKGKKIESIIKDFRPLNECFTLDIGTGSGIITAYLGHNFKRIVGIDIVDERKTRQGFEFIKATGTKMPFHNESFDIIISNQIIEHIKNKEEHIEEIYRVLKRDGICYLAAPNKLCLIETHYRLPFLSIIPKSLADFYLKLFKKGDYYDIYNLNFWDLKKLLADKFMIIDYTPYIIKNPKKYKENLPNFFNIIPLSLMKVLSPFSPSWIFIIKKRAL